MNLGDLLTPWLTLAAVILPLVYVEKWIHSHLYGVGWLLTNDKKSATALYYVLLFPGVFVHEFTQYLVAGALNVKIRRVIAWPEAQSDGTLRLDFVRIQKANRAQGAVIGAAPLITGLALIWVISSRVLSLDNVVTAIGTGDLDIIGSALRDAARAPDFLLWLYVIFTISNAMLPTPADRQGWPLVIIVFAVIIVFLVLIGVGDVLMETFTGPVANGVNQIATAFATVLLAEIPGMLTIGFLEEVLEKTTRRKFQYSQPSQARSRRGVREPGSNLPLPSGVPFPSIYNLDLPIPTPAEVKAAPPRPQRPAQLPEGPQTAASPSAEPRPRPAFSPTETTRRPESAASGSEERPLFRRPEGAPGPARPGSPLRSTPTAEDTEQPSPTGDERPSFRRPEGTPGAAQPGSPLRRTPADTQPPPADRFARPQPRPGAFRQAEDEEQPSGAGQRPSPFADRSLTPRRPSPFADVGEDEEEDEDEEITYEDFDDADSIQEDVYSDEEDEEEDE